MEDNLWLGSVKTLKSSILMLVVTMETERFENLMTARQR